jgi:hypothetical protein
MRIREFLVLTTMAVAGPLLAQQAVPPHNLLVELFTSEGCSSCPPADALLRELNGKRTDQGETLIVLSEHVTYWNRLGWADPYSAEVFTDRQAAYEDRFRLDSSYTPQIVVNGSLQYVGSNDQGVTRATNKLAPSATVAVHISSAAIHGSAVDVDYAIAGDVPPGADLFAVLADDADTSHVLRGENSGETLQHVSVARSLTRVKNAQAAAGKTVRLSLPADKPAGGRHVVLFVQSKGLGPVLSVDTKQL